MLTVKTPDEWLESIEKPALRELDGLTLGTDDVLITCAGFEERALSALRSAIAVGSRFRVLLIHYLPFLEQNRAAEILRLCESNAISVQQVTYDREKPANFGVTILDALASCEGTIVVDVSAMSRLLIVQTLVALRSSPAGYRRCAVVYCEAAHYPPTEDEAEAELQKSTVDPTSAVLFLSSGVFDVTVVPELSSIAPPGTHTRAIVYPSLDAHQLTAIRAEIHPSRFVFIEGKPPSPQNAWRREAIAKLNQLDQIENSQRELVSTLDYRDNLDLLLSLYRSHADRERIFVCPTGSKMQTVAVAIFRAFVRDVQIVYPTPQSFLRPDSYTVGSGPLHLLPLFPFVQPDDPVLSA